MRPFAVAVLVAILFLGTVAVALAAGSEPLSVRSRLATLQNPVEQQTASCPAPPCGTTYNPDTWVMNPNLVSTTGLVWDTDDGLELRAIGYLNAGQSFSVDDTIIADNAMHLMVGNAGSTKAGVTIAVAVVQTGRTASDPLDAFVNHTYVGTACLMTNSYALSDPILQPIPGSDGGDGGAVGVGTYQTLRWTITNTGSRRADIDAFLRVLWHENANDPTVCPNGVVGAP